MYFYFQNDQSDLRLDGYSFKTVDSDCQSFYVYEAMSITQVLTQFLYCQINEIECDSPDHDAGNAGWREGMVVPRINHISAIMKTFSEGLAWVDLADNDSRFHFMKLLSYHPAKIVWNVDMDKFKSHLKLEILSKILDGETLRLFK
jgi:hypothetical protein